MQWLLSTPPNSWTTQPRSQKTLQPPLRVQRWRSMLQTKKRSSQSKSMMYVILRSPPQMPICSVNAALGMFCLFLLFGLPPFPPVFVCFFLPFSWFCFENFAASVQFLVYILSAFAFLICLETNGIFLWLAGIESNPLHWSCNIRTFKLNPVHKVSLSLCPLL